MRTAAELFAVAAVLGCLSIPGSPQAVAADDSGARAENQSVAGNADAPSLTDSAETAFRKLDRGAKGYVTYDDVSGLPDFAAVFGNVDSSHLGRLNLAGFTQAWAAYAKAKN